MSYNYLHNKNYTAPHALSAIFKINYLLVRTGGHKVPRISPIIRFKYSKSAATRSEIFKGQSQSIITY